MMLVILVQIFLGIFRALLQHSGPNICIELHKSKKYNEEFPDLKLYHRAVTIGTLLGPLIGQILFIIGGPVLVFLSLAGTMAFNAAYVKMVLFEAFENYE